MTQGEAAALPCHAERQRRIRPLPLHNTRSQARVHRFALQREDAEDAFVDAAQRFLAREAFEGFDAEREFAQGEGALATEAALAQAFQVLGPVVLRAVDDPQVLAPATLDGG